MKHGFLLLLALLAGCAPVATLSPAQPVEGPAGTAGVSLAVGEKVAPLPYMSAAWGDGEREFGLVAQTGVGAYAKLALAPGLALRGTVGLPGPWLASDLLLDAGPVTLSGRVIWAPVRLGDGPARSLWLGGAGLTYWVGEIGAEASVLFSEAAVLPAFSVGYRWQPTR